MPEVSELPQTVGTWSAAELGHFYSSHRTDLLRYAARISGDAIKAEEFVQDALVKVLLAAPELGSAEHGLAYFRKTIQSLVIDQLRREGRSPRLVVLDEALEELNAASVTSDEDLSQHLVVVEDAVIVREALSLLSPAERTALLMWEVEGKSRAEIASLLGIRESSLRQTLFRARKSLRRILAERIIDESRGLTALDLLSHSYRKIAVATKQGSKVALSLALVAASFFGFASLSDANFQQISQPRVVAENDGDQGSAPLVGNPRERLSNPSKILDDVGSLDASKSEGVSTKSSLREFNNLSGTSNWFGLDSDGIPLGFVVSDALGNLGELFLTRKSPVITETGLMASYLVGTKSGAVNVLLDQSVMTDAFGTSFVASVSVGINGFWRPLAFSYMTSDIERLSTGNYLLTAILEVEEVLEGGVDLESPQTGRDLTSTPSQIALKLVLDPTKTSILAQSVQISANSQKGKA